MYFIALMLVWRLCQLDMENSFIYIETMFIKQIGIPLNLMETKFHFTASSKVAFPASHNKRGFLSGSSRNS
jgi:hypothetical protein